MVEQYFISSDGGHYGECSDTQGEIFAERIKERLQKKFPDVFFIIQRGDVVNPQDNDDPDGIFAIMQEIWLDILGYRK